MCLFTELNSQMKNQIHYHSIATTKINPPQILIYNKKYPPWKDFMYNPKRNSRPEAKI